MMNSEYITLIYLIEVNQKSLKVFITLNLLAHYIHTGTKHGHARQHL